MTVKTIVLALVLVASTTTAVFAQSQPNYGPKRNGGGDTYGEAYSGSAGARARSGGY